MHVVFSIRLFFSFVELCWVKNFWVSLAFLNSDPLTPIFHESLLHELRTLGCVHFYTGQISRSCSMFQDTNSNSFNRTLVALGFFISLYRAVEILKSRPFLEQCCSQSASALSSNTCVWCLVEKQNDCLLRIFRGLLRGPSILIVIEDIIKKQSVLRAWKYIAHRNFSLRLHLLSNM
jgi:hypothetical protein